MGQVATTLLSVVGFIVSAYLGAYLALRRFQREQLWQLRREAYVNVLTALHSIQVSMSQAIVHGNEVADEYKRLYEKGIEDVVHAVDVNGLILPTSAVEALETFRERRWETLKRHPDFEKDKDTDFKKKCEKLQFEALTARDLIVAIARKDLGANDRSISSTIKRAKQLISRPFKKKRDDALDLERQRLTSDSTPSGVRCL